MNKKEREEKQRRHRRRMRAITAFGLSVMLFLSIEYIRGGTVGVQKTIDQVMEEIICLTRQGRERMDAFWKAAKRVNGDSLQENLLPVEGHMQVHFLDVGQADCTLIRTDDAAMLIDAGNDEDGQWIVDYIREQGIERLDYVIGTHPHEDHIGGMDTVIEQLSVENVILPDVGADNGFYDAVNKMITAKQVGVHLAEQGQKYELDDAEFTVLSPVRDYGDELNNWSVGIRLTHGENAFVFTGDAEELAEIDMVESGLALRADVWKAGHHGSESSNTDWILDVVDPDYTVISCGKDNSYGHPHASVLREFERRGIEVFRTDEQGTIVAECDGERIMWNVEDKSPNGS